MKTSGDCGSYLRWALRLLGVGAACFLAVLLLRLLLFVPAGCSGRGRKTVAAGSCTVLQNTKDDSYKNVSFSLKNDLYFSSFDGALVYENRGSLGGTVARKPFVSELRMFEQVRQDVIAYLEGRGRQGLSRKDCRDIRYRVLAAAGMEFELICNSATSSGAERVVVVLPFQGSRVVFHAHVDKAQALGIIVPLQGRVEPLKRFLGNLLRVMRAGDLHVDLTVIYFDDHNTEDVTAALEAARRNGSLETQLILLSGEFSRSRALKIGVEKSNEGAEVVFLCDVDVMISRDFLFRCLASPVEGRQVFFPVFFSQHNPNLTYPVRGKSVPTAINLQAEDHHGYWRLWSYGMVCLYKSDFLKIDGFDSRTSGWGGEDIRFAKKVLTMNYSITRSLDHGLFHIYHTKDCSQAGKGHLGACLRVQALSEASGQTLGLWYFKQKHNASIWGVLGDEEMQTEDVKAAQGDKWEKEPMEEADEETEEWASAGILEDTLALQMTLLVMIVVNILLCSYVAHTHACRCSCVRQPQPDIG